MSDGPPPDVGHELTVLTTEHYTLQGARASALADMQGRASLYFTLLSSTLVAVAFIGQTMHLGTTFNAVVLTLFAALTVVGIMTFVRVTQAAVEDTVLAFGIARIRNRYVQLMPHLEPVFVRTIHDDMRGMAHEMMIASGPLQLLMPTAAVVAFATAAVAGVEIGFASSLAGAGIVIAVLIGLAGGGAGLAVLMTVSARMWSGIERKVPARHPSPASSKER